jgi:hypothetical protein
MATTTRPYAIDGKDTGALKGQTVQFPVFGSLEDVGTRTKDSADVLELAQSAFDVWLQGRVRTLAKGSKRTPPATLEQVQAFIDGATYSRRQESTGEAKPRSSGKIKALEATAVKFNANLDRAVRDPAWGAKALKLGAIEQADLDAYIAAQGATAPVQG